MKLSHLLVLIFLAACGDNDFNKVEELNSFRVLGIYSPTPEVAPGATANLQLIVTDVNGGGRVISGTTEACVDPGIGLGAAVRCDHDPARATGNVNVDTNALSSTLYTGLVPAISVTVPANILTGRSLRDQFNGVGYIVIFRLQDNGKTHTAFKRIVATNRASLNANPSGSALFLNGAPIGRTPDKDDRLSVTTSTPETYEYQTIEGEVETRTEKLTVAWYISKGEFDKPKSDIDDTVEFKDEAPVSPTVLLALVRDERGGLDFVRFFSP